MKEFKNIDKLIHESLAGYKPHPEAKNKERFLTSANKILAESQGNKFNWKYITIAIAIIMSIMGIVYYYLPDSNNIEIYNELSKTENGIKNDEHKESLLEINSNTSVHETIENNTFNKKVVDTPSDEVINKEPKLQSTDTELILYSGNDNNSTNLNRKNRIAVNIVGELNPSSIVWGKPKIKWLEKTKVALYVDKQCFEPEAT